MLWTILVKLVVGALIGWLASRIMKSEGGLIRNIFMGIVGSALGGYLASLLGISASGLGSLLVSVAGACLLIAIVDRLLRGKKRKK